MKKLLISLAIAMMLVAAMVVPAMAADTDTGDTAITGEVPEVIDVIPPDGFAMPSLDPSATQPISSGAKTVSVNYNGTGTWSLKIKDSKETNIGKMVKESTPLTNPLCVKGGDITGTALALTEERTLKAAGSGSASISDLTFEQTVAWADGVGIYTITVTFTAASTP